MALGNRKAADIVKRDVLLLLEEIIERRLPRHGKQQLPR